MMNEIKPASAPVVQNPPGTIDITDLVEHLKNLWVSWATDFVMLAFKTTFGFGWLGLPVVSQLAELIVSKVVGILAGALEMQGFFYNTAMRKASQAGDFIAAVQAKNALPPTATQEEFENAEKLQMATFSALVRVTQ